MDIAVMLEMVMTIVKLVMDKGTKEEQLGLAADLQAVAIEDGSAVSRLVARAAMCAANSDEEGQAKLYGLCERYAAIAEKAAANK